MIVYRTKTRHTFGKWLLAAFILVMVLSITTAEVDGFNFASKKQDTRVGSNDRNVDPPISPPPPGDTNPGDQPPVDSVPEPGTIILLASGLGAAYMMRRKKA